MPYLNVLDAALTWSSVFDIFKSVWTSVTGFIVDEPVLLAVIGVPLVVGFIAIISKAIR